MNLRKIYYFLNPEIRLLARRIYYFPKDILSLIFKNRHSIIPPNGMIFVGGGNFRKIGSMYLQRFKNLNLIQPSYRVLDIGCGIGRIAIPLTTFLSLEGSYEGFDIVKSGITWCNRHIKSNFSNFNFTHINLKNSLYNSKSKEIAKDLKFPYPDDEFDFVIATSLFTHMLVEDMDNYLSEIHRVLKKDGICYATFFLLNIESKISMASHDGLNFIFNHGEYSTYNHRVKEANVAYEEEYILNKYLPKNGLNPDKILYGFWCGRDRITSFDFQDTILISKIK